MEMIDQNNAIVESTTGSNYYVRILSTINRELLKPSTSVALHRHSNALVDVLPPEADSSISLLSQSEKPDVTYNSMNLCAFIFIALWYAQNGVWVSKRKFVDGDEPWKALIQYSDVQTASTARDSLDGRSILRYLLPSHVNECNLRISYSAHTDLNIKFQSHRSRV
ncbi:hypothetical protein OROMI_004927 [Orobanche minor]